MSWNMIFVSTLLLDLLTLKHTCNPPPSSVVLSYLETDWTLVNRAVPV